MSKAKKKTTPLQRQYRKNIRLIRRRIKLISKKRKKLVRTFNKRSLAYRKKLTGKTQRSSKKTTKSGKRAVIFGSVLLLATAANLLITVYAHRSPNIDALILTNKNGKQVAGAPSPVTTSGPAQTNSLFSTYPTWSQNFANEKNGTLNSRYWEINQGPAQNSNHEAEYYTDSPTNLHIRNGALTLEATKQPEPQGYNYASSRIDTSGKVSFLYGRVDIRAELPDGVGAWPAAWFLPANSKYEDLSPSSDNDRYLNGGEIDLVEEVGFQPNTEYGVVHSLSDLSNPNGVGAFNQITVPGNNVNYNTYTLLWTPTTITFEVNNSPFFTYSRPANANYTTWPFDQPFYMILNLAVGGSWGGEDTAQFPNGIDNSALPASMNVQSIYYYPYIGN